MKNPRRPFSTPRLYTVDINLPGKTLSLMLGVAFNNTERQSLVDKGKVYLRQYPQTSEILSEPMRENLWAPQGKMAGR